MKILILDDDPFVLKLLALQLRGLGLKKLGFVELVPCQRGHEAVALLEARHEEFGLIFCDLQMPEMDGVEFVRHLVRVGYLGGVVFVSGEEARVLMTAERFARAHGLKVLASLQKPVSPERLRTLLDETLAPTAEVHAHAGPDYGSDELRLAIEGGQLVNYYQPKVDLSSGTVTGVEALVRWRHPVDGLVMPDRFIALAEDYGLIEQLTKVVLEGALEQGRRWHAAGHALDVAVNVSMGTLCSLDFPDFVAQQARDAGFPLSSLMLEITESQLMDNPRLQLDILTRLRLKQVRLSIDDFGTGYSCLAQLRDLPFDELKVDRSFVHRAARNVSLRAILEASLGLARQLGMRTVAEGVEDREDWELLRWSGCDLAQGYLIARPMPGPDVESWIGNWECRHAELLLEL